MEDNLNFLENGREPQFFNMEDDLNLFNNVRRPHYLLPYCFFKRKTTSIYLRMEDDLNKIILKNTILPNRTAHTSRQPDQHNKQKYIGTIKNKQIYIK